MPVAVDRANATFVVRHLTVTAASAAVVLSGAAAAVFVFVLRDKGTDAAAAGEEAALGSGSRCAACQWG